jgi:hypothetical protein
VLLDGALAPQLRDLNLLAPPKYAAVEDPVIARKLLKAIYPRCKPEQATSRPSWKTARRTRRARG